jgi:hypothetical protein
MLWMDRPAPRDRSRLFKRNRVFGNGNHSGNFISITRDDSDVLTAKFHAVTAYVTTTMDGNTFCFIFYAGAYFLRIGLIKRQLCFGSLYCGRFFREAKADHWETIGGKKSITGIKMLVALSIDFACHFSVIIYPDMGFRHNLSWLIVLSEFLFGSLAPYYVSKDRRGVVKANKMASVWQNDAKIEKKWPIAAHHRLARVPSLLI